MKYTTILLPISGEQISGNCMTRVYLAANHAEAVDAFIAERKGSSDSLVGRTLLVTNGTYTKAFKFTLKSPVPYDVIPA